MYLRETGGGGMGSIDLAQEWGGMESIDLAQDRGRWRALMNTVLNLRVP
jgi:hypothetical protein